MALTPSQTHTGRAETAGASHSSAEQRLPLLEQRQLNFMNICCCSTTIQEAQLNPNSFHFQPNYILMQVTRS